MTVADLYIRVSTDEQADKGYSQRNQEEVLRKYCANNFIDVREVLYEDHSAKTFNRPTWKRWLLSLKRHKHNYEGLVLFTKWDRFSRNAGDAYQMINQLRSYGVEPQAIEQPLDLDIPENKMMLAFYLAAPEVENDRRALNIFHGMRRARKEGRWVSSAPAGYANCSTIDGRKYIAKRYPQADIMKWAFEEISKQEFNTEQIWKLACKKGLKTGRNNFYELIRNPVYCGKILVPAFKDEPAFWAEGQHEGIISETLFKSVQAILDGRGRKGRKVFVPDQLPLRNFIYCGKCDLPLSGSASKGRSAYYYYYHGFRGCKCRYKAEEVNSAFILLLKTLVPDKKYDPLFRKVLKNRLSVYLGVNDNHRVSVLKEMELINVRLAKAKELMISGDLEPPEFHEIKNDCNVKMNAFQIKLEKLPDLEKLLGELLSGRSAHLLQLDVIYKKANTEFKRRMISKMFKKLSYNQSVIITHGNSTILDILYRPTSDLANVR
ncbi:MAG: recombinase family protein [Bacteroidota bacterium]